MNTIPNGANTWPLREALLDLQQQVNTMESNSPTNSFGRGVLTSLQKPQGVEAPALGAAYANAPFYYDDFDVADGLLQSRVCPTGQTWLLSGTGAAAATITNRKFTAADNTYAYLDYGTTCSRVGGSFEFSSGSGTDNRATSILTLILDKTSVGLSDMLHLIISPTTWNLQKRIAAGSFTSIANGTHDLISGVEYQISFEVSGNTCTVYPPMGVPVSVTDTDIGTINGRYCCWQIKPDANGLIGKWTAVTMGPSQRGKIGALNGAAPNAEAGWLRGALGTTRKRIQFTVTGAGWYRISTSFIYITFLNMGSVTVSASTAAGSQVFAFDASTLFSGGPSLKQTFGYDTVGALISQARLSCDNASFATGLDIYVATGSAITISVDFVGLFTPVEKPVVGATALATASQVITYLKNGVAPTITIGTGVPSAAEPNGSIYQRSDGTGPNLYVRENGAWVAK